MNWKYFEPKFEYEEKFQDLAWPWAGHKYFAYDLVANLKPERIVELGTHYGTSLWSFSQAAKDQNIDAELNAVDTWEGEKHVGFYGEEVFKTVNEIKNRYYQDQKIKLIRKTFDEAVKEFDDKSIDILHIDGLHTYEAVKHDFETWILKVRDNGIVLFHDIVVTRDDFGVCKFWKELKERYQTMEFHYSYGLGVFFVNNNNEMFKIKDQLESRYSYFLEDFENKKILTLLGDLRKKKDELHKKNIEIKEKDDEIKFIKSSKFWKIRNMYMRAREVVRKLPYLIYRYSKMSIIVLRRDGLYVLIKRATCTIKKIFNLVYPSNEKASSYDRERKSEDSRLYENWTTLRKESREFNLQPLVSVIMPVYNVDIEWLERAIDSVISQFYENWELCVVDDASTKENIRPCLEKYAQRDRRIKIRFLEKNLHISASSNVALSMASGEFVAFLDNDDEFTPDALFEVVKIINKNKDVDIIYSDEDKIDDKGRYSEPTYKPSWNLDRMLHFMYSGHLAVYRKKIVDNVGRFRTEVNGAQDYDLMLRCAEKTDNICHIKKVLYHWRKLPTSVSVNPDAKSYAYEAGKKVLEDYLERNRIKGIVKMPKKGWYEIEKA